MRTKPGPFHKLGQPSVILMLFVAIIISQVDNLNSTPAREIKITSHNIQSFLFSSF